MSKVTKARKCPLCAKENLKPLSEHLKNKHKLLSKQERAPYLSRRLLKMKNEGEEEKQHFRKNGTVKSLIQFLKKLTKMTKQSQCWKCINANWGMISSISKTLLSKCKWRRLVQCKRTRCLRDLWELACGRSSSQFTKCWWKLLRHHCVLMRHLPPPERNRTILQVKLYQYTRRNRTMLNFLVGD